MTSASAAPQRTETPHSKQPEDCVRKDAHFSTWHCTHIRTRATGL